MMPCVEALRSYRRNNPLDLGEEKGEISILILTFLILI